MKFRLFIVSLFCALSVSPLLHAADDKDTPLAEEMSAMNRAFRQLKKQAAESTLGEASIPLVERMQASAKASLDMIPQKAGELPDAKRGAFIAAYREKMKATTDLLAKLATALKAGDTAEAARLVTTLGAEQRSAHEEFRQSKD